MGTRFKWSSVSKDSLGLLGNAVAGQAGRADIYDLTVGLNYRPHANVIIRPEFRYGWIRGASTAELDAVATDPDVTRLFESVRDQFTFGIDTIFNF